MLLLAPFYTLAYIVSRHPVCILACYKLVVIDQMPVEATRYIKVGMGILINRSISMKYTYSTDKAVNFSNTQVNIAPAEYQLSVLHLQHDHLWEDTQNTLHL